MSSLPDNDKITVSQQWLTGYLTTQHEQSYAQGKRAGQQNATGFEIGEEYGSVTYIQRVEADSRRALSRKVKALDRGHIDTGCSHDCSGMLCGQTATLLRVYRTNHKWVGAVEVNQSFDV